MPTVSADAIVSLLETRRYLFGTSGATVDTVRVVDLINRKSLQIETFLNRKIRPNRYTEYFNGRGVEHRSVTVKNPPVAAVSSLHDSLGNTFGNEDLIGTAQYEVHGEEGVVELKSASDPMNPDKGFHFSRGVRNIRVVYTGGFATVPEDLKDACLMLIESDYKKIVEKRIGLQSRSGPGGEAETYVQSAFPEAVRETLNLYRIIPHAEI